MARIRTIKPEFFTSEDIVSLSPMARLLYIALWCEADKEGRLHWKPKTFKLRYFPGDNCDMQELCAELTDACLVISYGSGLAYIPAFSKHQHVNPRESASDLPPPPGRSDAGPRKVGKNMRETVFARDGYACVRCGSKDRLECDHILPQSAGGPHTEENLRTLCKACNSARPVVGDALNEDLARDGHTIQSLRAKFGIDASIPDIDTQVGREGKGREGVIARVVDASSVDTDETPPGESKEPKTRSRSPTPKVEQPPGVTDQVWNDWLALRKAKKAPVTPTVIASAVEEARKAGMPLEAFLRLWCSRGSQGLQADWITPSERNGRQSAANSAEETQAYLNGQRQTPAQRAAAEEARRRVMASVKVVQP